MAMVAQTLEELAYELARRTLDQQEAMIGDLHARTGTLLTATALVTTFLGARALDGGNRVLSVIGVGLALASIVLCVYVMAPRRGLSLAISGSRPGGISPRRIRQLATRMPPSRIGSIASGTGISASSTDSISRIAQVP